mgnify:CR=1 FL=1
MILIALGANLPSKVGMPRNTCLAALEDIQHHNITVLDVSHWYESAPVPISDQPMFVNAVVSVDTSIPPSSLLSILLSIEDKFDRKRSKKNAPRTLDLDLIAYHDRVELGPPELPHPRLQDRAFVLKPVRDVAPNWKHPLTGQSVSDMISVLKAPNSATLLPS